MSNIQRQKIDFVEPIVFNNGNVLLNYDHTAEGKYQFQSIRMFLPFGISCNDYDGMKRYTIDAAIKGIEEAYVQDFINNISLIDKDIIEYLKSDNRPEQLAHLSSEDIDKLYCSSIKETKYHPQMRLRVVSQQGVIDSEFHDENDTFIDMYNVKEKHFKGYSAIFIIELSSIVITPERITPSWKIVRARVFPPQRITGYQFLD